MPSSKNYPKKKSKTITVSLTEEDYKIIVGYAQEREWSTSKTALKFMENKIQEVRKSYENNVKKY
jgi:hypothetical protein